GVFTRPELVVEPGIQQLLAFLLVLVGTLGLICSVHGEYSDNKYLDFVLRSALTLCSLAAVFIPSEPLAALAAVPTAAMVGYGFLRSRKIVATYGKVRA
ncbi:MAG: TRAP transporter permease, partial [Deltaproteobacteria bacterium]|nr:TRAP transporter permease [Deltaproteobacteria bacterium]